MPERSATHGWAYWLTPDLKLAVTLAAVCYCLFLFDSPWRLFGDADPGWHIRAGETILRTGTVPRSDSFSFLEPGRPWYAFEWGAEVVMAAVHRALGLTGIVFLFTAIIAATVWLWFQFHWMLGGNFLLACLMASPFISTTQIHWLARPHLFSYLLLLGTLYYCEKAPARFRFLDAALISAGMILWANLHPSFPMGVVLAGLYGAGHLLRREWEKARWFFLAGLLAAGASLLNPYGWNVHRHIVRFTLHPELRPGIAEWERFDFGQPNGFQLALVVGLAAAGCLIAWRQRQYPRALTIAFLLLIGWNASRGLPVLALLALPLANASFTAALRWKGLSSLSDQLRTLDMTRNGAALLPVLTAAMFAWLSMPAVKARTGFPARLYPVEAAAAVEKLPESSRIMASLLDGGYLIYRLEGRRKVFVDGRMDYFGPEPYQDFALIVRTSPGWQDRMAAYRFTHVLVESRFPIVGILQQAGWRRVHQDSRMSLLERPD